MTGTIIKVGATEYTVAPLDFGTLRAIFDASQSGAEMHPFDRAVAIVEAAIKQDTPEFDLKRVKGLDVNKLLDAMNEVLVLSGLRVASPGEAQAPSPGA